MLHDPLENLLLEQKEIRMKFWRVYLHPGVISKVPVLENEINSSLDNGRPHIGKTINSDPC